MFNKFTISWIANRQFNSAGQVVVRKRWLFGRSSWKQKMTSSSKNLVIELFQFGAVICFFTKCAQILGK